jgi:hypothetical protein
MRASLRSAGSFSAVGYFFVREGQRVREVAVGLIESDWGGTPAESWMSEPLLRAQRRACKNQWQATISPINAFEIKETVLPLVLSVLFLPGQPEAISCK